MYNTVVTGHAAFLEYLTYLDLRDLINYCAVYLIVLILHVCL